MSDTPRTDAEDAIWQRDYNNHRECDWPPISDVVSSDFARQLERELDAASERIKRLESILRRAEFAISFANLEPGVTRMLGDDYTEVLQLIRSELKETKP